MRPGDVFEHRHFVPLLVLTGLTLGGEAVLYSLLALAAASIVSDLLR